MIAVLAAVLLWCAVRAYRRRRPDVREVLEELAGFMLELLIPGLIAAALLAVIVLPVYFWGAS